MAKSLLGRERDAATMIAAAVSLANSYLYKHSHKGIQFTIIILLCLCLCVCVVHVDMVMCTRIIIYACGVVYYTKFVILL